KPAPQGPMTRWARLTQCLSCSASVGLRARQCPRCGAPRSLRTLTKVLAALGFGAVAVVFLICARLLGGPVAEVKTIKPVGEWSEDDGPEIQVVEVPVPSSPFLAAPAAEGTQTR